MRIVQIVPGSGDNFYCENCVRDIALVRALRNAGQDVVAVPLYLPQLLDTLDATTQSPIFFGGINTYLQQNFGLFRKTPRWLDRVLDTKPFLRLAAHNAGSVRAANLGEMTLSMLKGAEGNQAKELERLVRWLQQNGKPDVVHLSNPLLLGIGAEIKKRLGVPVVCSLQDEDGWIDAMKPPYPDLCWEILADGARAVDAFVAVSRYFGELMRERMKIDANRLHVVPIGMDSDGAPISPLPQSPPVIGYLARMSEPLGLGILVDAFLTLKKKEAFRNLRLHVSGGATADDAAFLGEVRRKISDQGAQGDVKFFEGFDPQTRREFLGSLSVFSLPAPNGVAFGTSILESLASGVPAVLPRLGAFPEWVEATGGGVLYEPNEAAMLAEAIGALLSDRRRMEELGRRGRESVGNDFGLDKMAKRMMKVYEGLPK